MDMYKNVIPLLLGAYVHSRYVLPYEDSPHLVCVVAAVAAGVQQSVMALQVLPPSDHGYGHTVLATRGVQG